MILAKICLLGDVYVGKTSLIRRYVDRSFSEKYLSTVGVTISRKLIHISPGPGRDPEDVQMIFWDLEGKQDFREISPAYLGGAHGAILVGDLTRDETLQTLDDTVKQFRTVNPGAHVIVALNKSDLLQNAGQTAPDYLVHGEGVVATLRTSAKTGDNVDELFETLGARLIHANGPPHR